LDTVQKDGKRIVPMVIYVVMGWMILFTLDPLLTAIPPAGFRWLLAGGIAYSVGIVFYVLDHRYPYAHGIWHLFVLAGSICHYLAILLYV
jgi:hemolysin III